MRWAKNPGENPACPVGLRLVAAVANHVTVLVLKHKLRSRVCASAQGQWHTVNLGVHDRDATDEVRVCSLGAKSVALALQFLPQDGVTSDDNRPVLREPDRVQVLDQWDSRELAICGMLHASDEDALSANANSKRQKR